jgi:PAS domain S-box-containing protein
MMRMVAATAAFASVYFLVAMLTGRLTGDSGIAVLWPASGVYLGVMLVAPRQMWSALACAAGIGSLAAYLQAGSSLEVSIAFAVPSSAEGLLGALLVERIAGRRLTLDGLRDVFALVLGGAVVANALVALSAGAVAAQTFHVSFAESWLRWWSADALGVIAVAPVITAPLRPWRMRAVALCGLGVALVTAYYSADGQVYAVQAFLAGLLLSSLVAAAALAERERALTERDRLREGGTEQLDDARRRAAQLTAELAARTAELSDARRGRERLAEEVRDSHAASGRTERELGDARSALAMAEQQLDALGGELARAREEQARTGEQLAAAMSGRRSVEHALERARAEFAAQRERLERSLEEARDSLSRAEAERRALADRAAEPSARYDNRGTCLDASPGFCRLLGYDPGELVGRPGAELLHPDDRPRLARARASRSASTFEARLLREAGDFVWVEVSLQPVWAQGDQRLVEIRTTFRDISDRRAPEQRWRFPHAQTAA